MNVLCFYKDNDKKLNNAGDKIVFSYINNQSITKPQLSIFYMFQVVNILEEQGNFILIFY